MIRDNTQAFDEFWTRDDAIAVDWWGVAIEDDHRCANCGAAIALDDEYWRTPTGRLICPDCL